MTSRPNASPCEYRFVSESITIKQCCQIILATQLKPKSRVSSMFTSRWSNLAVRRICDCFFVQCMRQSATNQIMTTNQILNCCPVNLCVIQQEGHVQLRSRNWASIGPNRSIARDSPMVDKRTCCALEMILTLSICLIAMIY